MKQPDLNSARFDLGQSVSSGAVQRFAHSAMATVFEVYCIHPDPGYARQAAHASFDLVDRLELELSRFIENSDIARINDLESGETAQVSPWTMECLQIARIIYERSGRTFDVSIGSGFHTLELDTDELRVSAQADGVRVDLGGIGKGYAVDRMAEVMDEWEIPQALLHGGFSSLLALEPPPNREGWPLTFSTPGTSAVLTRVTARRQAFSASGIQKRDHIIDPRSGYPVRDRLAAWVSLPCEMSEPGSGSGAGNSPAAVAEAWSTAFMILPAQEIRECCAGWPGLEAWLITEDGSGADAPHLVHYP